MKTKVEELQQKITILEFRVRQEKCEYIREVLENEKEKLVILRDKIEHNVPM